MLAQTAPLRNRFWVMISVTLAALMTTLDSTIANVALPHIQGSMAATQDQISWVLTSYILATAIMMPPSAFLANRFGRKNVLMVCIAGFLVASMLCGAATSLSQIVACRFLQGAFGAPLMPIIQAVLIDLYSDKERGKAMAIFGFGIMFGPIIGPTLGGILTDFYNWRWVFYINLPLGGLALAGIILFMRESERDLERRFDILGFGLLSITIAALQLALDRGQSLSWFASSEIVSELILSGLCFYLFLAHTFTAGQPFVEPALFRDRNFVAGLIASFFASAALMGTMTLMPLFLQNMLGIPVLTTGMLMAPRGLGTLLAILVTPRLVNIVDPRWLIFVGIAISGFALGQMAHFTLDVDSGTIIRVGFVQGIGLGFTLIPINILVFSTLHRRFRTEASSIFNLVRTLSGSLSISLLTTLLAKNTQAFHAQLTEAVNPFHDALPAMWDWHSSTGALVLDGVINRQAASMAYFNNFALMQWMVLLTVPLLFLFKSASVKPQPDDEESILIE